MLWLTPTRLEQRVLADEGMPDTLVCGFGLAAAGAVAATLIARHRPDSVGLIGIAGALSPEAVIGQAYEFGIVRCDGIGAGQGDAFQSARQMGWSHWEADEMIGDQIVIARLQNCLLSVAAASGDRTKAHQRRQSFEESDTVIAEDMEAFSVAIACRVAGVPLRVVRGISNVAGDREVSGWCIGPALSAAVRVIQSAGT